MNAERDQLGILPTLFYWKRVTVCFKKPNLLVVCGAII
jgi:hypothetical protein